MPSLNYVRGYIVWGVLVFKIFNSTNNSCHNWFTSNVRVDPPFNSNLSHASLSLYKLWTVPRFVLHIVPGFLLRGSPHIWLAHCRKNCMHSPEVPISCLLPSLLAAWIQQNPRLVILSRFLLSIVLHCLQESIPFPLLSLHYFWYLVHILYFCRYFLCFPTRWNHLYNFFPLFMKGKGDPVTLHNCVNLFWPILPVTNFASCSELEIDTSCSKKNSMPKFTAWSNPSR